MGDIATILYYTSNKEKDNFEQRIRETLLKNSGGIPIVSVSQKPINLGRNICVGDVGVSGFNMFRQVLIGCEACDSKFIISAEADCIYPPDYFTFIPERDDVPYRNINLYVMGNKRNYYFYKGGIGATHAQIVGREFYINTLKKLFYGAPQWSAEEKNFPKERWHKVDVFKKVELYRSENPVVQIKTGDSMRHYTATESREAIHQIPYWGSGRIISATYKGY